MPIMNTMGIRIREAREDKNLTQEALAKKCRVVCSAVARWETNVVMPGRDSWRYLLAALDVNEEWLRNGTGKKDDPDPRYVAHEHGSAYEVPALDDIIIETTKEMLKNMTEEEKRRELQGKRDKVELINLRKKLKKTAQDDHEPRRKVSRC